MIKFNLKHKQAALREEDDVKFIPYTRHVSDDVVALADGSLMRMYRVEAARSRLRMWRTSTTGTTSSTLPGARLAMIA
jgi:hypothetical protein